MRAARRSGWGWKLGLMPAVGMLLFVAWRIWSATHHPGRPATLPDGASVIDEDTYEDGSYRLLLLVRPRAFARWVEEMGLRELEPDPPEQRRWEGPERNGCVRWARFESSGELNVGSWGLACSESEDDGSVEPLDVEP